MLDVAIIGCGVVGAAAAYELSHYPLHVAVLEAENDVADATTKANSAILHAGYDPEPGTQMARLNVQGVALAKEICARLDVPYRQCGSLVLALSQAELPHLQKLYANGVANGVPGIRLLTAEETLAMEPQLAPTVAGALFAPSAAIVSPWEFALAMAEVAVRNGVELYRSTPVTNIEKIDGGWQLTTPNGSFAARYVVNAAGLNAQAIHEMAAPHTFTLEPTRGEYYLLDKSEGNRVNHVIFQCPNENGKGVLVTPTVHGNLLVGPNAQPVAGDDTACTADGLAFVAATARRSVPGIRFGESIRNFAGVRANVDTGDFVIGEADGAPGFIDLAGMKSPGLSSAPAVAKEVTKILAVHNDLPEPKTDYKDGRTRVRFKELPPEQKAKVEFLCNECCWFGCTERKRCYETVSRQNLGEDCPDHRCAAPDAAEGYRFSKAMRSPGFIGVEDIRQRYLPAGFSQFKIEGRGLGSALVLEFLLYYMIKPEYQLQVREAIYLNNMLDLF